MNAEMKLTPLRYMWYHPSSTHVTIFINSKIVLRELTSSMPYRAYLWYDLSSATCNDDLGAFVLDTCYNRMSCKPVNANTKR